MKKMRSTKTFILILAAGSLAVASCKKSADNSSGNETQLQQTTMQNAADQYQLQTDEETMNSDANTAVAANSSFAVGGTDNSLIAGAVVDYSLITDVVKKIKITYTGESILGFVRTGDITIELVNGNDWAEAGAILKITFENVKITFLGHWVIHNGTCYITNVSGGLAWISGADSIQHKERINGTVTFDDNSTITWWAARRNYYVKSISTFASHGDTLVNNENCSMGGMDRYGINFLVKAPQPIVSNATCGFDKPVSGIRIFAAENRNTTITFGVTQTGTPVNEGDCAYGYKVEWTQWNGQPGTAVISY